MSVDFMSELRCLVMLDGTVFGNVEKAATDKPMEIRLGDALSPFEPCTSEPEQILRSAAQQRLNHTALLQNTHVLPPEDAPGQIYAIWMNHLTDWALSGSDTVQVMINQYDAPCQIFLGSQIHIDTVKEGMTFRAALAAHRAAATLCVIFRDPVSLQEERHFTRFDTAYAGGPLRSGYDEISQPVPPHFQKCDVLLEIEYRHHEPDEKGTEPFLFLADVHVGAADEPVEARQILEPQWLYGMAEHADGQWIRAPLPNALVPGQDLAVQVGPEVFPIIPLSKPNFRLRENYGHTLICEADEKIEVVLSIDGQHVMPVHISPGDTIIRIPPSYLNGQVRRLSVKDRSGSVTLFEGDHLMPYTATPPDVMQRESTAPLPAALLPQTPRRYASLKALMANAAHLSTDFDQITHALNTLEAGPEKVVLKPLRFQQHAKPDVTVVIPAHNNIAFTYLTLCSLLVAHNRVSFEVILVDDASTDATKSLETFVSGISIVRHPHPQRFIRACNAGVDRARGTYVALLNNDVEVTTGWLDALVDAFSRFDNVGLVGSKLLYPNGDLQDAGGIVWGSGNPWNYGKGENPQDPRFCYARQADYLSGAALLAPRTVWQEVGGLSAYLEPMYFEDTDLAFKIREAGYATWYIPGSVVYHFEGTTSGQDVSTGFKKYQEVNRPKFKRQWANAFARHGSEAVRPDLEKDRGIVGRVLFIDQTVPRPDHDAGSYAAYQEMKLVQSLGYKVTFISTNMAHLGSYTEALQNDGIEVVHAPFFMNPAEYLDAHAGDFDAIYITRYYVAKNVLAQLRKQAPQAKILFNNADLHFLRELRTAASSGSDALLDQAKDTRSAELDVINQVDVVLSYNDVEHSVIQAYTDGAAKVVKCPWVVTLPDTVPPAQDRRGLSFLGSFAHHPNVEGITWFARSVMPRILTRLPRCGLSIYGAGMTDEIRALGNSRVTPVGFVDRLQDAFDPHRIFVAPLLSGAGIKGKVMSALAHGIPSVITPIAAEGIGLRSGHDCIIAETPQDWLQAIEALTQDDALWAEISQNARAYMQATFSFQKGRSVMRHAFEAADLYRSQP